MMLLALLSMSLDFGGALLTSELSPLGGRSTKSLNSRGPGQLTVVLLEGGSINVGTPKIQKKLPLNLGPIDKAHQECHACFGFGVEDDL